ncbi:MAG: ABC transporter ATP-binding protein [Eubacteriales bacterium]|nr:ABC transporter ATP-binding protein [Eubacteriales bacterium]
MNNPGFGGKGGGAMGGKNAVSMGRPAEKIENRSAVIKRMGGYMLKHKITVLFALIIMIVSNVLALAGPKLSEGAISAIEKYSETGSVDFDSVYFYCGLMIVFYIASAVLSYILSITLVKLGQKIVYTMRRELFNHLTELSVGFFDTHVTGDIISRISYDIDTVNASLSHDLLQICTSAITVVGSLVMMLTISPILVVVFVVTVPISILFTRYKTKKIRPLFRLRSAKLGQLNGYAEEMLSGQKTIRAYDREKTICARFNEKNTDSVNAYYNADYHGAAIGPTVNFVNNLSLSLIIMVGGIMYMFTTQKGAENIPAMFVISLGAISAFIQYSRKFAGPINEFANILSDLQSACAAAERVFKMLDEPSEDAISRKKFGDIENADALDPGKVEGRVDIDDVTFGYTTERTIIKNLNLNVKPGQLIAIVGPTGAGKTTIINLLMRFYDVEKGEIRIDGHDIKRVPRKDIRLSYTMVLQDTWLFGGTIRENIVYGKQDATDEEVIAAAKAAKIHSFIEKLPDGYDTLLTDDGVNISKGQKQLITIVRAMLPDSSMLILDEATSNVDSRTEIQIQQAMYALMENKTCFVIAHRLSTIRNADKILVVKDGNVIEQGDHNELMRQKGFYYSLFNSQFE